MRGPWSPLFPDNGRVLTECLPAICLGSPQGCAPDAFQHDRLDGQVGDAIPETCSPHAKDAAIISTGGNRGAPIGPSDFSGRPGRLLPWAAGSLKR
jgi:hypothetical protein